MHVAPLFPYGRFDGLESLLIAVAIGIAFGWALERAGLGSAPKLAGQFYLTDFTVLKVMFSAIVTAAVGVFCLGRLGVLDLSRVAVPQTYLLPQLVGGLVFGLGFLVAGLCPGTSCVAAASGRLDGLAVMAGMFMGALLMGLGFAPLASFYASTPRGVLTLPAVLHLPEGVVLLALVLLAMGVFWLVGRIERRGVLNAGTSIRIPPGTADRISGARR